MVMPPVDPTANVIALVEENKRYNDMRFSHMEQSLNAALQHQRELREAEAGRLDSIRQVDREDVRSNTAAATRTAETLRDQVATTAKALQDQVVTFTSEVNKRLLALELAISGSVGKGEGGKQMWGWIVSGIILAIAVAKFVMDGGK